MTPKRTSHIQLPSGDEIAGIVAAESKRQKPTSKIGLRYVKFDKIIALYQHFGLDATFFEDRGQTAQEILDLGGAATTKLADKILTSDYTSAGRLFNEVYDYLAEEDSLSKADFIFVFGSSTEHRAQKGIELYKNGLGGQLLFSGHVPSYADKSVRPEAEVYAELAINAGIPDKDIIIEKESITLPDNIRRSLNLLDARNLPYSSFILVNSPYAQRRGWCVFKKYTLDDAKIMRANSHTRSEYSRQNWYKNQAGLAIILGEYIKLRNAVTFDDV